MYVHIYIYIYKYVIKTRVCDVKTRSSLQTTRSGTILNHVFSLENIYTSHYVFSINRLVSVTALCAVIFSVLYCAPTFRTS